MRKLFEIAILALAFAALSAFAAEPAPIQDPEKVRQECDKQGEAAGNKAVAEATLQHPGDAAIIKQRAKQNKVNECLRLAGMASGPIRAK